MKLLMITMLLAASTLVLLMGIDVMMGFKLGKIVPKVLNPFRIMDPTEYLLLFLLVLFFLIQVFSHFRKNKQKGNPPNSPSNS